MTTDKQPASKPPIEQVGPYRNNTAPAAAKAGVGAKSLAEIQDALDARRRHNPGRHYFEPLVQLPLG